MKNAKFMSNLRVYTKVCWADDVVNSAQKAGSAFAAHAIFEQKNLQDGSITAAFECKAKGKVTYSYCQHTKTEAWYVIFIVYISCTNLLRAEIVCWVAESMHPFCIVED